jgi:CheY-like chemotaxis protein
MSNPVKAGIPIIAMTANAFEEDKRDAQRAGMNGHLPKPINVHELYKTLMGIFE